MNAFIYINISQPESLKTEVSFKKVLESLQYHLQSATSDERKCGIQIRYCLSETLTCPGKSCRPFGDNVIRRCYKLNWFHADGWPRIAKIWDAGRSFSPPPSNGKGYFGESGGIKRRTGKSYEASSSLTFRFDNFLTFYGNITNA